MSPEELRKMLLVVLPYVSTIETDPTHSDRGADPVYPPTKIRGVHRVCR